MRRVSMGLVVLLVAAAAGAQFSDRPECRSGVAVPNPPMNCPDRFAWEKFVQVVTPVAAGLSTFQTWATDQDTFPCPPADAETCTRTPAAAGCPVWPQQPAAKPTTSSQRSARATQPLALQVAHRSPDSCLTNPASARELVYRNEPTFRYIVEQGLWYVEGVEAAFERGLVFDFPTASIEVKANWYVLDAAQVASGRYYTWTQQKTTYGLVAMHISTKDLPNWFWSTFEHVDNPGRCDFLGCHDSFGVEPAVEPARYAPLCDLYPPGELTSELESMLAGLPPVFKNYRLKGSMVDYTTATGSPVLLGNSVTEAGFVPTASCMTCHARAATQGLAGAPNGLSPYPNVAGFTQDNQSFNGVPDPSWYYAGNNPLHRWAIQTDFVWAIPFRASSLRATKACCSGQVGSGPPGCQCQAPGICSGGS